jgi:DNA-binding NarL/FixJ family response regulator
VRSQAPVTRQEAPASRVVLAEDGALLREGLAGLLGRFGFRVAAAVGDAAALVAAVAEYSPDLVITDIRMPPGFTDEGLRAAVELRAADPGLAVVVLSQYVQHGYAAELLDSGGGRGVGYLLKDRVADVEEFIDALRRVAAGGTVVDPEVISRLIRRRRDPLAELSPREREVLALMAEGQSNAAIARRLVVSEAAVEKHVGNILFKLRLPPTEDTNRRVLAVLAYLRSSGQGRLGARPGSFAAFPLSPAGARTVKSLRVVSTFPGGSCERPLRHVPRAGGAVPSHDEDSDPPGEPGFHDVR